MFVCNVFAMSLQCLCNGCVRWVAHTLYIGAAAAAADPVLHEARTRDPADATLPDPHLSGLWQGRHRPRHHGRAAPGQCGRGGCRGRGGFVWAGWGVFARSFCLNRNPTLSLSLRAALDTNHTNRTYHTNRGGGGDWVRGLQEFVGICKELGLHLDELSRSQTANPSPGRKPSPRMNSRWSR